MAKRISIINFKGGVGKTTLAFHLASGLAAYHAAKVLVIDVDHQSSLSILLLSSPRWEQLVKSNLTLSTLFTRHMQNNSLPGGELIVNSCKSPFQNLDLVPASLQLDEIELDLAATSASAPHLTEWNKRSLICQWLDATGCDSIYDYIIFDCPPATKLITQNALAASHGVILPVIPDSLSLRGLPHLIGIVFNKIDSNLNQLAQHLRYAGYTIPSTYVSVTQLTGIVVSMLRSHGPAASGYTNEHTINLSTLASTYSKDIIIPFIEYGTGIQECLSDGLPVYCCAHNSNVTSRNYIQIFQEITSSLKTKIDAL